MQDVKQKRRLLEIFTNENVDFKREIMAGITTFLTMAYIIAVNPNILSAAGMDAGALVTATCLAAGLSTILMGVFANLPFALASGMGLNAYFAFTVVGQNKIPWEIALTAVFVEGIIFILLSLFKVREAVVDAIPINLKYAVTAGIGLFIAFIGFNGAGVVIGNPDTMVAMGQVGPKMLIAMVGLCIIVILEKKKVKGSMLVGIVVSTLLAWGYALINTEAAASMGIYLPNGIFKFESIAPIAGKVNFSYLTSPQHVFNFITIVFTFLFVDFFDTVGTLIGVASRANMLDKKGRVPNAGKALMTDAIATTAGALLGTSTVTVYVESATGVEEGGRTGLTACTTGILFFVSILFSPIVLSAVTNAVTAPALVIVGILMAQQLKEIEWDEMVYAIAGFITIVMMILTYSISNGIAFGFIAYAIAMVAAGKIKEIHITVWVLMVIFVIYFALPQFM